MLRLFFVVLVLSVCPSFSLADAGECSRVQGECYNRPVALRLKIVAVFAILVTSMIGVCLPLFSRSVPALRPDRNLFVMVKAFASGVILSTAFMHVLPDSFDQLTSPCLPENPWSKFPFTTFIAMVSAVFTLMLDSFMMVFYKRKKNKCPAASGQVVDQRSPFNEMTTPPVVSSHGQGHSAILQHPKDVDEEGMLLRNRIVAQVLEAGIVVHSVIIGLSLGTSESPCTIKPLIAALCFHQFFEGMGLGGCILQAEYNLKVKTIMVFFFSFTTPFGVALGIALTKAYDENSPAALIVVGVLDAVSSGLLIYTALVDLLAADFLGPKLQESARLQVWAYVAVFLGVGGMSLMAKWA